ncbi:MAG: hypothetical protein QNK40_14795 [Desulfobacterales bacterium]|nr:hypothetical protein [Desulfobacterales bacterium]
MEPDDKQPVTDLIFTVHRPRKQIIKKGAFLTLKAGEETNTMTIGWATIGHIWRKDVFMV